MQSSTAQLLRSAECTGQQLSTLLRRSFGALPAFFPNEPTAPSVHTSTLPGPKSNALLERLGNHQERKSTTFFVDYANSVGNYIKDVDGNAFLDTFMQISSLPLGYNHPSLIEAMRSDDSVLAAVSRPALAVYPSLSYLERVENCLIPLAPRGMSKVYTLMCGTCFNENAVKQVFMWYQRNQRDGKPFTELDLTTCMNNQAPGTPNLAVLSFQGAFHGRSYGMLGVNSSKALHKVDVPSPDWPRAPFPQLKYPLDANVDHNQKEIARCLNEADKLIKQWAAKGMPVACAIIEPIQAEGGDNHALPEYFIGLQELCKQHGIGLVVDEVQTSFATGRRWAHEAWGLPEPPHAVTFSKKMFTGGYFYRDDMEVQEGFRIFNTWMGDMSKLILLEAFVKVCDEHQLLERSVEVGQQLSNGLHQLSEKYPGKLENIRGKAGFQALDCSTPQARDALITAARFKGLHLGASGSRSIRFRPALIFEKRHVDITLDIFDQCLKK